MLPDVERGGEAVDVLGDAQLGDAALGRDLAVALGVGGGEVLLGGRARVVRAQVDVVVGQHRSRRIMSATRRSCGVVTLKFAGEDSTTRTLPPARSTSQASSVACARIASSTASAASSAARRNACGVCTAHSRERSSVAMTATVLGLLDRVGHGRRRDRAVGVRERRHDTPEQLGLDQRPRRVVDDDLIRRSRRASAARTDSRARRAAAHADAARGRGDAPRQRDDDLLDPGRAQRVQRPLDHRPPGDLHERLRTIRAEPRARARGHQERG